jgi:HAD superfamily hydrolase (TIGR01490 family)
MAENIIRLAIFDFDGTLSTGHLWTGIAKHHRENKVQRIALYSYLFSHLPFWFATKLKLYSEENNRVKWGEDLSHLFKGFTREDTQKVFIWLTDNYFMPLMRSDVMDELKAHRQQGYKIMILSGMFSGFLQTIGQKLGVDYVVGTELEMVNTVYSGRIIKPLCFGKNKAKYLTDFIHLNQLDVDLRQSTAFADSIYDVPVFQLVGTPVVTYPDKRLFQMAVQRKWKVIGQQQSSIP